MKQFNCKIFFAIIIFSASIFSYEKVSAVLHIHTKYSNEKFFSIEEIVQKCVEHNIDVVGINDHDIVKVELGIKPFDRIIKKTFEQRSVLKIGVEKYLEEIKSISKKYPEVIIIPGVESTPCYYWSYDKRNFILHNLHKHLLISGLLNKEEFLKLPVLGNEKLSGEFNLFFLLLPVVGICFVVVFFKNGKLKIILVFFMLIFLLSNYPFKYLPFDYYKDYGELPYQNLINYVNNIGDDKLIIWAHPDAPNWQEGKLIKENKFFKVFTKTEKYSKALLDTKNYDGFAIFAEGYKETGKIGGVWDRVLLEYCSGKRHKPAWCFAENDYGENPDEIYVRKNILFVKEKDYDSIIDAYKKGRFYSLWRGKDKELELYNFNFSNGKDFVKFGEEIGCYDKINISGTIKFSDNSQEDIRIYIIKDGALKELVETKTPYVLNFVDTPDFAGKEKVYYRIFIESKYPNMISTNPVFVSRK